MEGAAWGVVVVGAAVVSGAAASGAEEVVSSKAEDSAWELSSSWEASGDGGCTVAEASKADSVWETAEEVPSSRETVGDGVSSPGPAQPPSNSMAAQRSTAKTLFLVFIFFPSFQKRKIDYNTTMPAKFMPDSKACWAA